MSIDKATAIKEWNALVDELFAVDEQPQTGADDLRTAYSPDQAREPAGSPDGGQFSSGKKDFTVSNLTETLKATKEAHHQYEKSTGVPDQDWAGWYASFVTGKVSSPKDGEVTTERMKQLITEASKIHTGEDWPEKYAEYIHHAMTLTK